MTITLFSEKTEERLVFLLFARAVTYYLNYILAIQGADGYASRIFYPFMTVYAVYIILCEVMMQGKRAMVIIEITVALLVISYAVHGNEVFGFSSVREYILSNTNILLSIVLPVTLLCMHGVNVERILDRSRFISNVIIIMQVLIAILTITTHKKPISEDYMSFSYYGILSLFVCCYYRKRNIKQRILVLLGIALQLFAGCRGAMITTIVFCLLLVVCPRKEINVKSFLCGLVIMMIIVALIFKLDEVLDFFSMSMERIGFSSRTLDKVRGEDGGFFSGDRLILYHTAVRNITAFGKGVFGEQRILGTYSHNWVLDILIDYGYCIGTIIAITICALTVVAFIKVRKCMNNSISVFMLAVAIALIFGKFMLSASYLTDPEFVLSISFIYYIYKFKATPHSANRKLQMQPRLF